MLTGKPTGKRTLGKHRRRWEDNINIDKQGPDFDDLKIL